MNDHIRYDQEILVKNLEKLPLYVRTLIYLASGASMIANDMIMRQFAETGRYCSPTSAYDAEFIDYSQEMVS